ncbi:hypothetical protein [Variovorax sp. GT1P44]|uniref:hypothetical protein n=1 Tax=Variovorax sp. GT1P44 TaxID=3443742 RepID=UPI003F450010
MTMPRTRSNVAADGRLGRKERESTVLRALGELPAECRTPSGAVIALLRQGIDIPHSTIAQILLRLERRGVIRLERKRC